MKDWVKRTYFTREYLVKLAVYLISVGVSYVVARKIRENMEVM